MAKDLRSLLEPANKGANALESTAPLAQRRNLMSPGEPRVFRVKAGFVCGLCGRLHSKLEPAFDCLGRCTIELRLRSPSGRSNGDAPSHHACTACGKGFANSDDAEECFERCLNRMRPTPQFEAALRKVQIRYVQRLQAHGVRPLQRIDPFSEHTKMLVTLTREQEAMGRQVDLPEKPITRAVVSDAARHHETESAEPNAKFIPPQDGLMLNQVTEHPAQTHAEAPAETQIPTLPKIEVQQSEPVQSIDEMELESNLMADMDIQNEPEPAGSTAEVQMPVGSSSEAQAENEGVSALLESGDSEQQSDLSLQEPEMSLSEDLQETLSNENSLDLSASSEPNENHELEASNDSAPSESALSMLAIASTSSEVSPPEKSALDELKSDSSMDDFSLALVGGNTDDSTNAFAEASDFANVADQPETNVLAADVLALLQTSSNDQELQLSAKDAKILKEKMVKIDENLLDAVSDAIQESAGSTVFLRKDGMKPYRRNNAKYCCSACSSEFFTKEQVEACFYSHPEEGSPEAQALLNKVKNNSKKSAA